MFGLFKKKPKTALEQVHALTIERFRPLLVNNRNLSDEKIIEIVQLVMKAFIQAAESKGETISGTSLLNISEKFIKVYDLGDPDFFREHLKYEITLYLTSGLRDDYR